MFSNWLTKTHKRVMKWFDPESFADSDDSDSEEYSAEDFKKEVPDSDVIVIDDKTVAPVILSASPQRPKETLKTVKDYALELNKHYKDNLSSRLLTPLLKQNFKIEVAWFNDVIVNDYFSEITKNNPQLYCLDSMYVDFKNPDFFERLKRNARFKQRIENDFKRANLVFWPAPIKNHWYLLIIDKSNSPVMFYTLDGLNTKEIGKNILFDFGMKLLAVLQPELIASSEEELNVIAQALPVPVLSQTNAYDCGSVICQWGDTIAKHFVREGKMPSLDKSSIDYTAFRLNIAQSLIAAAHRKEATSSEQEQFSVLGKRRREHIG